MAQGTRSSAGIVKPLRDPDFVYEEKQTEEECLENSSRKGENQLQEVAAEGKISSKVIDDKGIPHKSSWTDINFYPINNNANFAHDNVKSKILTVKPKTAEQPNSETIEKEEEANVVVNIAAARRTSSTTFGYLSQLPLLSQSECFLSVSDIDPNNSPIMSGTEESVGAYGLADEEDIFDDPETDQMHEALKGAVKKIDFLEGKVKSLMEVVGSQNKIIVEQKEMLKTVEDSKSESGNNSGQKEAKSASNKTGRVLDEKARTLKLLRGKLDLDDMGGVESEEGVQCSDTEEPVSVKGMRKKMTKKQRDLCSSRVSARLRQSGNKFPEDDFNATASSGKESCNENESCRHSKVKSGASIKKRPVLRTEL